MLGSSLASPLATFGSVKCFRHPTLCLNLSYHGVVGGIRTSRGPRNKWIVVCSPTQVETSGDEPKTWEECKEALSCFDFSVEEQDKILGKAFGHIHSPYWTEERVKENPKVETLKHVLEFLRSLGLSDEDLHKVLKKFPEVLGCSLEEEMKPNIGILENQWGITGKSLRSLLLRIRKCWGTMWIVKEIVLLSALGVGFGFSLSLVRLFFKEKRWFVSSPPSYGFTTATKINKH